ncbi:MAG: exopolyphosphatase [Bacteroidia bacterium]|jgi:exopolyphosphatase / guanosine-5'-triphosphate,3'-diphosphate pyrophosphatase|nr:exopolyphosphatase [Bacteroidia bacterium]
MRFAAIDIGSNAVRLLLCNVYDQDGEPVFKKAELVRMPIRLGEDAFRFKRITEEKKEKLAKTMKAFKLLIDVFGAVDFRACATAAMREADNGPEVIRYIKQQSGIEIEIIDGKTEAQIIYSNHIEEHLDHDQSYLYIDVGGGSTELTLFARNKVVASQSFNIGTIRLLHDQVSKETWSYFKDWVKEKTIPYYPLTAIGSGGNINKLFKMADKKENKPLTLAKIQEVYSFLKEFSVEDRITRLGLNPDRADVIVPATKIFLTVMKTAVIDKILVPQIGLSDGIIHLLYEKNKRQTELF